MQDRQTSCFEAWLDEERRIVSFHAIPASRYFTAAEAEFWAQIVALVLDGYRIQ